MDWLFYASAATVLGACTVMFASGLLKGSTQPAYRAPRSRRTKR